MRGRETYRVLDIGGDIEWISLEFLRDVSMP
jgi:hypothetical protein